MKRNPLEIEPVFSWKLVTCQHAISMGWRLGKVLFISIHNTRNWLMLNRGGWIRVCLSWNKHHETHKARKRKPRMTKSSSLMFTGQAHSLNWTRDSMPNFQIVNLVFRAFPFSPYFPREKPWKWDWRKNIYQLLTERGVITGKPGAYSKLWLKEGRFLEG